MDFETSQGLQREAALESQVAKLQNENGKLIAEIIALKCKLQESVLSKMAAGCLPDPPAINPLDFIHHSPDR